MKTKRALPKIGSKIHRAFQPGNRNNESAEVRGFVDEQIVCVQWWKHKQRWHYFLLHFFEWQEERWGWKSGPLPRAMVPRARDS